MERLDKVRYVMAGGSLIACFLNLIKELSSGDGLGQIAAYSGIMLLAAILLVTIDKEIILPVVFIIVGIVMLMDVQETGRLTAGVGIVGYGTYLAKNRMLRILVYLIFGITIITMHVVHCSTPDDLINVIMGYTVLFALNELVYK